MFRVLFCESMDEPDTPFCHSSVPPGLKHSESVGFFLRVKYSSDQKQLIRKK